MNDKWEWSDVPGCLFTIGMTIGALRLAYEFITPIIVISLLSIPIIRIYLVLFSDPKKGKPFFTKPEKGRYFNPVAYRGAKWLKWYEEKTNPVPKELHFSSKTTEEEKEKIKDETFFRYYWAEKFNSDDFLKTELLKYEHPNKVINTALNLEYAMGYRGYYDNSLIEDDDYSILEEIEKCRNNPRYFTISYYRNYYNNGDNIFALKGQEMPLGKLMTKLVSMQFLPKIKPSFSKDDYRYSPATDNYNLYIEYGDAFIDDYLIDEDSRLDYRDNEYCTITLDARDALASNTIPENLVLPNNKDRYMRERHQVYLEDKRVILYVDLPDSAIICKEGVPFQKSTKVKILSVFYNSTDGLHTKEEIEEYKRELQALKIKFEQEIEDGENLDN